MDFVNTMTTEEERGTCGECERTDQKDCIVLKVGAAGNPIFACPDCVRGKQTGESSESEEESEEEHYEPVFTEGQVRKFTTPLLEGLRECDIDGKWWVAIKDSWLPWCECGFPHHPEDCPVEECDCGESDCDKEHVCECCQQETDYDDLYKCDDCHNLYCDDCGTGKGGQCRECESDSDDDE